VEAQVHHVSAGGSELVVCGHTGDVGRQSRGTGTERCDDDSTCGGERSSRGCRYSKVVDSISERSIRVCLLL